MFKDIYFSKIDCKIKTMNEDQSQRFLKKIFVSLERNNPKLIEKKLKKYKLLSSVEHIRNESEEMFHYVQGFSVKESNVFIEYGTKSVQTVNPPLDIIISEYFFIKKNTYEFYLLKGFYSIPKNNKTISLYHYFQSLASYPKLAV